VIVGDLGCVVYISGDSYVVGVVLVVCIACVCVVVDDSRFTTRRCKGVEGGYDVCVFW